MVKMLESGKKEMSKKKILSITNSLKKRNKLIRIADRSPGGKHTEGNDILKGNQSFSLSFGDKSSFRKSNRRFEK